jgi:FGGY-family pentulose kinase
MPGQNHVVAVDVGTGSARAGVFDPSGNLLGRSEHPILIQRPLANHAEHDSEDIWRAVGMAVRGALSAAKIEPASVMGISYDATCSLVVRDHAGAPLSVSTTGEDRWDTIVWLDHRALAESEECTRTHHPVLDYIGGVMSPEMETPKLMWLKRHFPDRWQRAGYFFDLADYLTWRSTGRLDRSQCTLACKWTYLGHGGKTWQPDYLERIGIGDMTERGRLPRESSPIGKALGPLTVEAAEALGLTTRTQVGVSLIDAHAGALGVIGGLAGPGGDIEQHLALIAGTSSCIMALSSQPIPIRGVWGPYYGAVLPQQWLNEAGQSASGALLDHVIQTHSVGGAPDREAHRRITARIMELRKDEGLGLAGRLHVLPDFHGNRSPLADPQAVGVISGLTLDASFDSLCCLYWRTCVSIALGVRHILDALNAKGYEIDTLHVTGGHTRNPLLMELYTDATGCTVVEPDAEDAVLLGTAMVAATGAGAFSSLGEAAAAMRQGGRIRRPDPSARERFDRDYRVFLRMHEHRAEIDGLLAER